jgi:hypothetical protein
VSFSLRGSLQAVTAVVAIAAAGPGTAELTNHEAPVIVGHYDLNVTSVAEHKRFWVDTLGGKATRIGNVDAIEFPDVYLLLHVRPPTGPTRGTTFDHIGFAVPDVPALTTKVVANGYALTVGREPAPGETASPPTAGNYGRFSYLVGPDGVKVELVTNMDEGAPPIKHHHVHFVNREFVAMQQWYMKAFDATLRDGQTDFFIGADLPGVGYMLNFFSWLPRSRGVLQAPRRERHRARIAARARPRARHRNGEARRSLGHGHRVDRRVAPLAERSRWTRSPSRRRAVGVDAGA